MAPAVEYTSFQPRNSCTTPTTTKMAARMAERCATARPPSLRSIWGICGICGFAGRPAAPKRGSPLPAAAWSVFCGVALKSMPPMTRCMMAARTSEAMSAPKMKFCNACHMGRENT